MTQILQHPESLLCVVCSIVFLLVNVEMLLSWCTQILHCILVFFFFLEAVAGKVCSEEDFFSLFKDRKACLRSTGSGGSFP